MFVLAGRTLFSDVDDTLVSWDFTYGEPGPDKMEFVDPVDGSTVYLKVIRPTIEAMKLHRLRGHKIIVWSAGDGAWASEVVTKLGLAGTVVDACISKPEWILDDLPASEFIPESIRRDLSKEIK
jgi:hypothetical protein